MNKLKAIICVGCSASGKSSFAREQCKDWKWLNIERDIIREFIMTTQFHFPSSGNNLMVDNLYQHWKFKNESLVNAEFDLNIHRAVINKFNIVVSDTNLNKERRDALKLKLEALEYDVEIKVFGLDLNLDELRKRDLYRKNSVGHAIIAKQYAQFRKEFPKYHLRDVTGKPEAVLFDIDGTLAHMNGRSPFEWDKVGTDTYDELLFISLIAYYESGYKIILMSGRDSVCRQDTIDWFVEGLIKFGSSCKFDYELYMRPENDQRKDSIIKTELFMNHIDGNYKVKAVFDDRPSVLRNVWYEFGFNTYAVGNQNLEF